MHGFECERERAIVCVCVTVRTVFVCVCMFVFMNVCMNVCMLCMDVDGCCAAPAGSTHYYRHPTLLFVYQLEMCPDFIRQRDEGDVRVGRVRQMPSYQLFCAVKKELYPNVEIVTRREQKVCDTCADLQREAAAATTRQQRAEVNDKIRDHRADTKAERQVEEALMAHASAHPDKVLMLLFDATNDRKLPSAPYPHPVCGLTVTVCWF